MTATDLDAAVDAMRSLGLDDLRVLLLETTRRKNQLTHQPDREKYVYGIGALAKELGMEYKVVQAHLIVGEHPLIAKRALPALRGQKNAKRWLRSDIAAFKAGDLR